MELEEDIVIIGITSGLCLGLLSMCLNFIIKSRCKKIEVCCCKVERDVITQANISENIIRIPNI
tara:strand:- start:1347 stop:1538 length:192 start_codon:yes stop_codon:yes gene_type:complete